MSLRAPAVVICLTATAAFAQSDDLAPPVLHPASKKKSHPAHKGTVATHPAHSSAPSAPPAAPAPAVSAPPVEGSKVETHTLLAQPDLAAPLAEPPPPPPVVPLESQPSGLRVSARAGVTAPLSLLAAGVSAGAQLSYRPLASGLLDLSLGVGYERHAGLGSRLFPGPGGGLDGAAFENQSLMPVQLAVSLAPWRDELNRLSLGARYGLLGVWTGTHALGSDAAESGLGHEFSLEASYARHLGPLDLFLRADWSVRRTRVGPRTGALELPWYQVLGLSAGLTFPL